MVSYSFEGNKRLWTVRDEEENEKIFCQQSKPTGVKIPHYIKPTYLANAEYDVEKWPLAQLMHLLRLYAAHRCLWDVSCKDNRNRKMRHAALVDVTAALDSGFTKEQVVQKINILRATYRYEKKRIKQRIRRGLGARTKLKWFALADAFLRNVPKKGHKEEDPSNSDSDLEDTIVFTINPESLVSLEQENSIENYQDYKDNGENSFETEIYTDDSQTNSTVWELAKTADPKEENKERIGKQLEMEESQTKIQEIQQDLVMNKKSAWSLEDSLKFIQLLEDYKVLEAGKLQQEFALKAVAKEMHYDFKSIEKRWLILQNTFEKEMQIIKENSLYKPNYKWWPAAERFFAKKLTKELIEIKDKAEEDMTTESIFLTETKSLASTDDEDYENRFLQNPIPSVAPLSNMNEAMASLFHATEEEDDLSQESNTNSSFPKENDSSSSGKFVWQGLEDDLLEGKWSLKHSVKFLRLYGVHRCLWDLNDPDYRSRPLRNAAIEDIAASMGHGLTASYVAKKIKIFRITYMQQRKRLLEANEKGEKPEIILKWFPLADSFLRPHIGLRSIKSDAKEMPQFDYQYVYANLNLIDPALLTDFRGKGTQNAIEIGNSDSDIMEMEAVEN
ncbi:uncharacterized protein LOC119609786 [Lucilia sericata]|uniref:uncharacterized protein LOC119609786 n=1 Tax=Lucilia sericata TaxID=13632 RepID=UPI0018A825C7|nr:uncharacterized protein LOC119609786 [Lucilia sericata]XP_037820639.1 uncharacterized protein LOC119609786 [Lucilia sericata]